MNTFEVTTICPNCGRENELQSKAVGDGDDGPSVDAIAICWSCKIPSVYKKNAVGAFVLVKLEDAGFSDEEMQEVRDLVKTTLRNTRNAATPEAAVALQRLVDDDNVALLDLEHGFNGPRLFSMWNKRHGWPPPEDLAIVIYPDRDGEQIGVISVDELRQIEPEKMVRLHVTYLKRTYVGDDLKHPEVDKMLTGARYRVERRRND